MAKNIIDRINNTTGEIWCNWKKHWVMPEKMNIKTTVDKSQVYYQSYCKECVLEYNRERQRKIVTGEHVPKTLTKKNDYLRINNTPDDIVEMKKMLQSIGYDTEQNIHEQFMKKYKYLIDNPKWF